VFTLIGDATRCERVIADVGCVERIASADERIF